MGKPGQFLLLLLLAMAFIVAAAVFFFGLGVSRFFLGSPPSVPLVGFQNRRVHRESRTPLRGSGHVKAFRVGTLLLPFFFLWLLFFLQLLLLAD